MTDTISRADAIDAVCRTRCGDKAKGCPAHSCLVIEEFDALPSVKTHEIRTETHECVKGTHDTDLILRADALRELNGACSNWEDDSRVQEIVMALPSADAVHGEWIFNPTDAIDLMFAKPKCSKCGFESSDCGNFCPNCGARMKGGDTE